jgi:PAS domain S-box-containing protein
MSRRTLSPRYRAADRSPAAPRPTLGFGALPQDISPADKFRLAAIVEFSHDGIISWNRKGIMDSWNRGAEQLYGYAASEAIGQPIAMLIPPHLARSEAAIRKKVWRGERVDIYETQRLAKNGSLVDISLTISPIKNAAGVTVGLSVIGHDIRDRRRYEVERSRLMEQLAERVKELTAMYQVAHLLQQEEQSTTSLLGELTSLLPKAWRYPEVAAARVQLGEVEFKTPNFRSSRWSQQAGFTAADGRKGAVEIVYLAKRPPSVEGPFMAEERNLINGVAEGLKAYWDRKRLESEILGISEREQRRIGQDLHDGLTQHLRGVAYLSHVLHETLRKQSRNVSTDSARITQLLDQAVEQARSLARGLLPVALEPGGLMIALRSLAVTTKDIYRIPCRFVCRKPVLIHDNPTATHLYRIAQESVNNAIRHGNATRLLIALSATDSAVTLRVQDNGRGIPHPLPSTQGMGLEIMKYRARVIGGRVAFKPAPRGGAVVTCVLPSALKSPTRRTS